MSSVDAIPEAMEAAGKAITAGLLPFWCSAGTMLDDSAPCVDSGPNHSLNAVVPPAVLYRSIPEKEYAIAFSRGRIRLSTLEICRNHESALRRDEGEATEQYSSGYIQGPSEDAGVQRIAARLRLGLRGIGKVTISDCEVDDRIRDAWVLCFSLSRRAIFGDHCIRVDDPASFFRAMTDTLQRESGRGLSPAWGEVTYGERHYQGLAPSPGPIGFVKPLRFRPDDEFRMLWRPEGRAPIDFKSVDCPAIADYCTLL